MRARPRPRSARPPAVDGALARRERPRGLELFTRSLAVPPSLRGEPLLEIAGASFRRWDPSTSKLGAALVLGWDGPRPREGERWLYLGAASGTTASHVADLVGPGAPVYAVEPSVRPFLRLLETAERYPNLLPVLGDARRPDEYPGPVGIVDGIYADVAQPDQPEIVAANAAAYLREGGTLLFVVKTASLGRDARPVDALRRALARLPSELACGPPFALDPFHRRHFLVAAEYRPRAVGRSRPPERRGGPSTLRLARRERRRP